MKARKLLGALPFVLLAALLLGVFCFPQSVVEPAARRALTVWNVDTFEGGKGSRADFLRGVAREAEASREGVYFLVTSYTPEGARAALGEGRAPDILSFGIGLDCFLEQSLPLSFSFEGGKVGKDCLAVPWYMGGYYLFSMTDDFQTPGKCAISSGGSNLAAVAARLAGIEGEETDALSAYTAFLGGSCRYLLGTQRDVQRFLARGVEPFRKPLPAYNDLLGYVSVLGGGEDAFFFVDELLSARTREKLGQIGLEPPAFSGETLTPSVFSDADALSDLLARARSGADADDLGKYLKRI